MLVCGCVCVSPVATCHREIEKVVEEVECGAVGAEPQSAVTQIPRDAAPAAAPAHSPPPTCS